MLGTGGAGGYLSASGTCLPCASAAADAGGVTDGGSAPFIPPTSPYPPSCELGPASPLSCPRRSWTFPHDLRIDGDVGLLSAPLFNASVGAGYMAYLRATPPHAHGVLRLLVQVDGLGWPSIAFDSLR